MDCKSDNDCPSNYFCAINGGINTNQNDFLNYLRPKNICAKKPSGLCRLRCGKYTSFCNYDDNSNETLCVCGDIAPLSGGLLSRRPADTQPKACYINRI